MCVCRCHAHVELCDKYKTNIHTFQHKSEALEGCNPRCSFVTEHTTNKNMRKGQHGIPRFCASMYIAPVTDILFSSLMPSHVPMPVYQCPPPTKHCAHAPLWYGYLCRSLSFCQSACARLSFFSLQLSKIRIPFLPFPSIAPSHPQSPIPIP